MQADRQTGRQHTVSFSRVFCPILSLLFIAALLARHSSFLPSSSFTSSSLFSSSSSPFFSSSSPPTLLLLMSTTPKETSRPSTPQPRSTSLSPASTANSSPSRTFSHAHAHAQSPSQHYHSAPLPQSPSQSNFGSPSSPEQQPMSTQRSSTPVQSALSRAVSSSNVHSTAAEGAATDTTTTTIAAAATTASPLPPPFPPTAQPGHRNSGSSNGSSIAMADTRTQFNTSEIERSFQALLKKQPVATPGPAVLHGRGHRHLLPRDAKPRHYLSPHHHGHRSGSESNGHSPVFGSPAADHARHWIKSVGQVHDRASDSEGEGHHAESDQDSAEDSQQQQWQIDYDHHIAGHVELETDENDGAVRTPLKLQDPHCQGQEDLQEPLSPSASSWTGTVHPMFSMAGKCRRRSQGSAPLLCLFLVC